jgi:hypothetical protein
MPPKYDPSHKGRGPVTAPQRQPAPHVLQAKSLGPPRTAVPPATHVQAAVAQARMGLPRTVRALVPNARVALPAVAARPAVQCSHLGHVESTYQTEHGSTYTVDEQGLTRQRYYGGTSVGPNKSVFYGDEETTEQCLKMSKICASYKVTPAGFGTVTITFYDRFHKSIYSGKLQEWPQAGLYPVDMILRENGTGEKNDHFHVGDKIV